MEAGAKGKTYKIGQAAKLLDVKPFVLRFWESEFKDVLVPVRTPSGQRAYTEGNVDLVREIKRLLYDEGLTIEGAKKRLRESKGAPPGKPAAASPAAVPPAAESPPRSAVLSGQPSLLAPAQPSLQPDHAGAGQAANSAALAAAQAATAAAEQSAREADKRAEALAANLSNILTELRAIRDLLD